ncbi:MAG: hypothetical protein KatS3mg004_0179 [Bryobacteraceae bacterium]|nr:MAG: hypothetical protein KatS3mg004_0179 [Bryobacteraceae bacterium]
MYRKDFEFDVLQQWVNRGEGLLPFAWVEVVENKSGVGIDPIWELLHRGCPGPYRSGIEDLYRTSSK